MSFLGQFVIQVEFMFTQNVVISLNIDHAHSYGVKDYRVLKTLVYLW